METYLSVASYIFVGAFGFFIGVYAAFYHFVSRGGSIDFKHQTNQALLLILIYIAMAILIVISLCLSGDIYNLNCVKNCYDH